MEDNITWISPDVVIHGTTTYTWKTIPEYEVKVDNDWLKNYESILNNMLKEVEEPEPEVKELELVEIALLKEL